MNKLYGLQRKTVQCILKIARDTSVNNITRGSLSLTKVKRDYKTDLLASENKPFSIH